MASDEGLRKFADAVGYGSDMTYKSTAWMRLDAIQEILLPMSNVDHPAHYGGADDPYEAIKVIDAWQLGFSLGNAIKYIARAGRKDPAKHIEDLEKARWYLCYEIDRLKSEAGGRC